MKNEVSKEMTFEELAIISKENALATQGMLKSLGIVLERVDKHNTEIKEIKDDVVQLKFNEEITDSQVSVITTAVKSLATEAVGYPSHLYRLAIHDIYSHLKGHWRMGAKVRTTTKGNYDSVMQGIDLYEPNVEKLEERYQANLKAKEGK